MSAVVVVSLFVAHAGPTEARVALTPGLYEVHVETALLNTYNSALRTTVRHCITAADLATGRAFFVFSETPLRACALQHTHYHGTIHMQMGGKNMTLVETQHAVRVAACE